MGAATFAAIGLLVLYVVVWTICLNGWRVAKQRYGHRLAPSRFRGLDAESVPGVTVIRPLCGLDNNLYKTLESNMRIDYPKYEVIFALQDEDDEAIPVVKMLMKRYPHVDASIVINATKVGVNPKVNNLMEPFRRAKYDLLWVIDATICTTPHVLGRMVDAFVSRPKTDVENSPLLNDSERPPPARGDVGLVHQVPIAVVYQRSWGSLIEQAYLNSTHAKMYLSINNVAIESCVVGKSNLYSRANIASLTTPSPTLQKLPHPPRGLGGFGPFMAEDNMIALSLWHELGLKHAMTGDVALDFVGAMSVRGYIDRRARWIRVRKKMTLPATLLEPLTESIVAGIYSSWAIHYLTGGGVPAWLWWILNQVLWLAVDLDVRRNLSTNVRDMGPEPTIPAFIAAWAAREALALPIWIYAMVGSTVMWRGNRYRILASGECSAQSGAGARATRRRGRRRDMEETDQDVRAVRDQDVKPETDQDVRTGRNQDTAMPSQENPTPAARRRTTTKADAHRRGGETRP